MRACPKPRGRQAVQAARAGRQHRLSPNRHSVRDPQLRRDACRSTGGSRNSQGAASLKEPLPAGGQPAGAPEGRVAALAFRVRGVAGGPSWEGNRRWRSRCGDGGRFMVNSAWQALQAGPANSRQSGLLSELLLWQGLARAEAGPGGRRSAALNAATRIKPRRRPLAGRRANAAELQGGAGRNGHTGAGGGDP